MICPLLESKHLLKFSFLFFFLFVFLKFYFFVLFHKLKEPIIWPQDWLSFGTQNIPHGMTKIWSAFDHETLLRVLKIISMNLLIRFSHFFLEFVYFPRIKIPTNESRRTKKLSKISKFHQNDKKINKCWFLSKFYRQIFTLDHKVHGVWFLISYVNFSWKYIILNKNNFCKIPKKRFFLTFQM